MKNLFDFATKELSQDAFLVWLVENWNETDDKELQITAIDFIIFLTGRKIQFNPEKGKIVTHSQIKHIDITIDVYPDKNENKHDIIVIEDKVYSSEHKQLKAYDETVNEWKKNGSNVGNVYKVFYKTSKLSNEDVNGIEAANENQSDKWVPFDIDKIWGFFNDKNKSTSQLLNWYVEYIDKLHSDHEEISKEKAEKWNLFNWDTFLKAKVDLDFKGLGCYTMSYRGMYYSLLLNYDIKDNEFLRCATLEFIVRDTIEPFFHPSFRIINKDGKEEWKWSINDLGDNEKAKEELDGLRSFVGSVKSRIIVRSNKSRSFGRKKDKKMIEYKEKNADAVWEDLKIYIQEYKIILDGYVNQIKEKK